ncbi:hypothetical protein L9F63_024872, partial [Diploptera punctata]
RKLFPLWRNEKKKVCSVITNNMLTSTVHSVLSKYQLSHYAIICGSTDLHTFIYSVSTLGCSDSSRRVTFPPRVSVAEFVHRHTVNCVKSIATKYLGKFHTTCTSFGQFLLHLL